VVIGSLNEGVRVAGAGNKAVCCEETDKILVINVVALAEAVVGANDLAKRVIVRGWNVGGHASDELGLAGVGAGERVFVKERCRDVKAECDKLKVVNACVGERGGQGECAMGSIRCASKRLTVGVWWLSVASKGNASGDIGVELLANDKLGRDEDGCWFDSDRWDGTKRGVLNKYFVNLFGNGRIYFSGIQNGECLAQGPFILLPRGRGRS